MQYLAEQKSNTDERVDPEPTARPRDSLPPGIALTYNPPALPLPAEATESRAPPGLSEYLTSSLL